MKNLKKTNLNTEIIKELQNLKYEHEEDDEDDLENLINDDIPPTSTIRQKDLMKESQETTSPEAQNRLRFQLAHFIL